jgi:uncharacterized protein YbjT (DUF2867 family)
MILITGATGAVGKELVKRLARPAERVRALVRDRNRAASIGFPGVDLVEGDFAKVETLDDAMSGVHKAFLLTAPGPDQLDYESRFLEAASRSNLKHIVKLSALGADPDSEARLLRAHGESERRLIASGIPYTVLRPNQFMQNFLSMRDPIIHRGEFYAPMGDGRISLVDVRDVAAVAAGVLEEYGHEDKVYDITGPEALTYAGVAERFTEALAKPVTYVDVAPEKMAEILVQAGISEWMTDALLELYAYWKFNGAAEVSGAVRHVAKKDPISFRDFAHEYSTAFGYHDRDPLKKVTDAITFDSMTPGS